MKLVLISADSNYATSFSAAVEEETTSSSDQAKTYALSPVPQPGVLNPTHLVSLSFQTLSPEP